MAHAPPSAPVPPKAPVTAYFCMEYALDPSLPIYAGGLGALAGDHFKAAGDLGLPFFAVGIRWREGYVRQEISENGQQKDRFIEWVPPPELMNTGIQTSIEVYDAPLALEIWQLRRGSATLLLLDVARGEDHPLADSLSRRLYEGSSKIRVAQEMVLGIGGVRALATLGIRPDVYHFNEGHAALGGIELIRERMRAGFPFREAWEQVRRHIVFTTHTPVEAGNEEHSLDLLAEMGACNGLTRPELTAIGGSPFSMTVAGLRLSRRANAVSRLHGLTARQMWRGVAEAAPITSITNGVHRATWQHPYIAEAYDRRAPLLPVHRQLKHYLLSELRKATGQHIDPNRLLIASARRATPYKRGALLFQQPELVESLLEDGLAVVYAGKAHPNDSGGKEVVAQLVALARRYPNAVVFLPDYDLRWATLLVQGSDVWLNQPIPPMEASGTSGMKAAMNGVLNLSILDGWWAEGCHEGRNGWQFGDAYIGPNQDQHDVQSLYRVLREKVFPAYRQPETFWEPMMRHAIETSVWAFSAHRMVIDYWNLMYRNSEDPGALAGVIGHAAQHVRQPEVLVSH